jgi:hypothetical protein
MPLERVRALQKSCRFRQDLHKLYYGAGVEPIAEIVTLEA